MDSATMKHAVRRHRAVDAAPVRQRGAVAIIVALSLAVLLGFVGLAIDGGHLYVTKTELQNGADACALAAAYELTGAPSIPAAAFARAEAAGLTVVQKNNVDFQHVPIAAANTRVEFGTSLTTGGWVSAATAPGDAKYVRCTIERSGIAPYLMQVVGAGNQTVSALAAASLSPSQTNCAVPMGLCTKGSSSTFGYTKGEWVPMDFDQQASGSYSGNFRWVDLNPGAGSTDCKGQGAKELSCLLAGSGVCNLPPPTVGTCAGSTSGNPLPGCVGQTGAINSLDKGYNTRFGVYVNGGYTVSEAPPDHTGYAYSTENWNPTPPGNAYSGTFAGQTNFSDAYKASLPIQSNPNITSPALYASNDTIATQAQYTNGASRRLVIAPIIDCPSYFNGSGTQHAPIRAYACILMLDPYRKTGNKVKSRLEFEGLSNESGSPCASSGEAGDTTSQGPMVPSLVQ